MRYRLGIEMLSVLGMPPVEHVNLAADLGCQHISTGLMSLGGGPHDYPPWSLKDDPALRREMVAALRDRGVSISLGEGLTVRPGMEVQARAAELDAMRELGVTRINTVSLDPDLPRTLDQFATLAEMARALGIETTTEFAPGLTIATLPAALAAVRHVAHSDFRLLIDTMHLVRSGSSAADIAALEPGMIGYVQLCDVPLVSRYASYMEEAMTDRLPPGAGELPLRAILAALPRHLVVSLEVPQRALAQSGIGPRERLAPAVAAARGLLAEAWA